MNRKFWLIVSVCALAALCLTGCGAFRGVKQRFQEMRPGVAKWSGMEKAVNRDIVKGYGGEGFDTYEPDKPASRREVATIMIRALEYVEGLALLALAIALIALVIALIALFRPAALQRWLDNRREEQRTGVAEPPTSRSTPLGAPAPSDYREGTTTPGASAPEGGSTGMSETDWMRGALLEALRGANEVALAAVNNQRSADGYLGRIPITINNSNNPGFAPIFHQEGQEVHAAGKVDIKNKERVETHEHNGLDIGELAELACFVLSEDDDWMDDDIGGSTLSDDDTLYDEEEPTETEETRL